MLRLIMLAVVLAIVVTFGYFGPSEVLGIKNPLHHAKWVTAWYRPWYLPVGYLVTVLVLGYESHGTVLFLIGGILLAWFGLKEETVWMGPCNVGAMRWTRSMGVTTIGLGALFLFAPGFIDAGIVAVTLAVLYYFDRDLIKEASALIKGKDRPKSA